MRVIQNGPSSASYFATALSIASAPKSMGLGLVYRFMR
jgi:hypothetical protein